MLLFLINIILPIISSWMNSPELIVGEKSTYDHGHVELNNFCRQGCKVSGPNLVPYLNLKPTCVVCG
jgi:hypothetical protein